MRLAAIEHTLDQMLAAHAPRWAKARLEPLARRRPERAAQLAACLAETGDADAAWRLAEAYRTGVGVPPSGTEALRWTRQAAESGQADAQARLASLCLAGYGTAGDNTSLFGAVTPGPPDLAAAAQWAERAVAGGSVEAKALLGTCLWSMPEPDRDPARARLLLEQAAAGGSARGALGLAIVLAADPSDQAAQDRIPGLLAQAAAEGLTRAQLLLAGLSDGPDAVALYRRAAEAGDREGAYAFGIALLDGTGVAPDRAHAETWLRRAAVAGHAEAARRLGEAYLADENPTEALSWFRRASAAGSIEAAVRAADLLLTGRHRDHAAAAGQLKRAAAAGHPGAMFGLGALYGGGYEHPADATTARLWFEQAAERGYGPAQRMLGHYQRLGVGGPRDLEAARGWLEKALAQGIAEAKADLLLIQVGMGGG